MGHAGVDFFMFLSGFGLCCNYYNKEELNISRFYKRRLLKIIPTYFVCIILFAFLNKLPINDMLWQMTCVSFWILKPSYDWYIPSILLLYFLFPFYVKNSKMIGITKMTLICIVVGLILTGILIYLWKGEAILFTSRIPIFFIGCYVGFLYANKIGFKHAKLLVYMSFVAFIIEWYLTFKIDYIWMYRTALHNLPFIFIVPGMCIFISWILEKVPKKMLLPLSYLGTITLEIYLIHLPLRLLCPEYKYSLPIVGAIVLHYFVKYIMKSSFYTISILRNH